MIAEYVTTDINLSAFLCHKGATLLSLRRVCQQRVDFRFLANENRSCGALSSWRHAASGLESASHRSSSGSRAFTLFTL